MKNKMVLGADIGGSHITTALVNLDSRQIDTCSLVRKPINCQGSVTEIINGWGSAIELCIGAYSDKLKIGMAMPGPFNYDSGVSWIKGFHKYDALFGLNVKELLADRLGILPSDILLKNDAGCFLQGELFSGVAQGYDHVYGFTLGTGFGSAIGINGIAEDAGLWASPFGNGMAEDYFSTKWFIKRYGQLADMYFSDVESIAKLVGRDAAANKVFEEFSENIGTYFANLVGEHKPEMIVLGGNIVHASKLFFPALLKKIAVTYSSTVLKKSALGEEAALIGAASLWQKILEQAHL